MRYTVKIVDEGVITNDLKTDSYAEACKHESTAISVYGKENVLIWDKFHGICLG